MKIGFEAAMFDSNLVGFEDAIRFVGELRLPAGTENVLEVRRIKDMIIRAMTIEAARRRKEGLSKRR